MYEIITDWRLPTSSGGLTVMYFASAVQTVEAAREAVGTYWESVNALLADGAEWTVRTTGREVDPENGALAGFWADPTPYTGFGAISGSPVANATMAVQQWLTESIVRRRQVRGRTFIPGLHPTSLFNGQLSTGSVSALTAAGSTLVADVDSTLVVWSRPVNGVGGSEHGVSAASAWVELGVQRRRRD